MGDPNSKDRDAYVSMQYKEARNTGELGDRGKGRYLQRAGKFKDSTSCSSKPGQTARE
jgi:hypothetical protein